MTEPSILIVTARLAITHPCLPRGIDFTDNFKSDLHRNYRKKEPQQLDKWPEESFRPSMKSLKVMLSSVSVER